MVAGALLPSHAMAGLWGRISPHSVLSLSLSLSFFLSLSFSFFFSVLRSFSPSALRSFSLSTQRFVSLTSSRVFHRNTPISQPQSPGIACLGLLRCTIAISENKKLPQGSSAAGVHASHTYFPYGRSNNRAWVPSASLVRVKVPPPSKVTASPAFICCDAAAALPVARCR